MSLSYVLIIGLFGVNAQSLNIFHAVNCCCRGNWHMCVDLLDTYFVT